ncbi:MAG: AbrB/MazE/SpoVT family DNA-binding domain-containing protein [Desulfatiglans sp.]|nr:AbrB/MazE/SpoVT family DNA-binding domain-containing protein [Desulfatiglans sp.]
MTSIKLNNAVNRNPKGHIDQILKEFEKGCDEAIIRREGKRLIIEPKKRSEDTNNRPASRGLTFLPLGDIRI